MKKIFKWIFAKPAGCFARLAMVRTGLMASLAAGLVIVPSCTKEPEIEIETDDSVQAGVSDDAWGSGADIGLSPDREGRVRVNALLSRLPAGAEVSADGTQVVLPHSGVDMVLVVESDDELELVSSAEAYLFKAEQLSQDAASFQNGGGQGYEGLNYFRISKGLYAPGVPEACVSLQFRRKTLDYVYPEDNVTVSLSANPVKMDGEMDFDSPDYSYDFGRYVDNELGVFIVPSGTSVSVEFAGDEDSWAKLEPVSGQSGAWRLLGGWRPNDPTADGRRQDAVIVIENEVTGREEYMVSRRNFGLPVTWLHGVWWCKYNSMGDSRDFGDQILSSEDPAALAGMTVFRYLESASAEEYRDLWQWAYIGGSGHGMKVTEKDGVAVMDGYAPAQVNINSLPADALSPDGYELPSMEDFNRVFDGEGTMWMAWDGSYRLKSPWNGHSVINRVQGRKNGVQVGSLILSDLLYVGLSSPDFPEHEPLVWYGPSAQWNEQGIEHSGHYNNILFSVCSPSGEGWYFGGNMGNLFAYKNGAGPKDTRILRFKKSPVEYIY